MGEEFFSERLKGRDWEGFNEAAAEAIVDGVLAGAAGGHEGLDASIQAEGGEGVLSGAMAWNDFLDHDFVGGDACERTSVLSEEFFASMGREGFEAGAVLEVDGDSGFDDAGKRNV